MEAITCDADGKPFVHEIDLVWDFELDGKSHRTVFQAKDWTYCVDKPTLMTFCGVLADLPGNPYGVIVTKTGFDSTLIPYAKARGVGLYILDALGDADFISCIPSVEVKIDQAQDGYRLALLQTFHPTNSDGTYKENDPAHASDAALAMTKLPSDTVELRDAQDTLVGTLETLLREVHRQAQADGVTLFPICRHFALNVDKPLYLCTNDLKYPRVQIGGVGCEIVKIPIGETIIFNSTLSHILQFCTNGEHYFVDNDFCIHKAGDTFKKLIEIEVGPDGNKQPFFVAFSIPIRSLEGPLKPTRKTKATKTTTTKKIKKKT
jgi:hypothetical protein